MKTNPDHVEDTVAVNVARTCAHFYEKNEKKREEATIRIAKNKNPQDHGTQSLPAKYLLPLEYLVGR